METPEIKTEPSQLRFSGGKDQVYDQGRQPFPFEFNGEVAAVFDDMARRSIPLYEEVMTWTMATAVDQVASWRAEGRSPAIWDLGSSTGTLLEAIARCLDARSLHADLIGFDNSAAMVRRAEEKLRPWSGQLPYHFYCMDFANDPWPAALHDLPSEPAVVVANYTLQFLEPNTRRQFVSQVANAMPSGSMLIVSEKLRFAEPQLQSMLTARYEQFKLKNGYSRTEIERKKEALHNVLVPFTKHQQEQMLLDAGFQSVSTVMQWNQFSTLCAIR